MQTTLTSVASAAVISGDLIIGLSDGSIINCGRVQGPQGLTGDQGPMGATGRSGTDGNTILTVQGTPDTTVGKDGDFAINVTVWEIYGPRAGGVWGTGTPLRGNKRNGGSEQRDNLFGNNSQSEGGGGKAYNTSNLPLTGLGRVTAPGGNIIPDGLNLTYQSNANKWIVDSLQALDVALPIKKVDSLPAEGAYEGDMVFMSGGLHVWVDGKWEAIGGGGGDTSDLQARVEALEKALFPYVEFTDEARSLSYYAGASYQNPSVRMYQYWNTSPAGEWMWAWMIKFPGTDIWTDVDDLSSSEQASIGYDGVEDGVYLMLYPSDPDDLPDIEVSLKVTDSLDGFTTAEGWSDPFFPRETWINQGVTSSSVAASTRPSKSGRGKITLPQP